MNRRIWRPKTLKYSVGLCMWHGAHTTENPSAIAPNGEITFPNDFFFFLLFLPSSLLFLSLDPLALLLCFPDVFLFLLFFLLPLLRVTHSSFNRPFDRRNEGTLIRQRRKKRKKTKKKKETENKEEKKEKEEKKKKKKSEMYMCSSKVRSTRLLFFLPCYVYLYVCRAVGLVTLSQTRLWYMQYYVCASSTLDRRLDHTCWLIPYLETGKNQIKAAVCGSSLPQLPPRTCTQLSPRGRQLD